MEKKRITIEHVRERLLELHPDINTSVHVAIWSHGDVTVRLSAHPEELIGKACWSLQARSDRYAEASALGIGERIERALAEVLALAEADKWNKPVLPSPEQATVHAG